MTIAIVSALGLFSATRADAQASPPTNVPPPPASAPAAPPPAPSVTASSPAAPAEAGQATAPAVAAPPVAPPPAVPAVAPVVVAPPSPAKAPPKESNYDGPPLLLGRKMAIGGYGGPSVAYTPMLNRDGALVGIEGALLLGHRLSIGAAGYGFTRSPNGPPTADGIPRELGAGYGGFVLRYAFLTSFPVYPSVGMLIGGGAVVLHEDWDHDHHHDDYDSDNDEVDGFFVFQPEVSAHANLTRWMRLGVSVGYRVTSKVHRFGLEESDINGVTVGGNMQFGWF